MTHPASPSTTISAHEAMAIFPKLRSWAVVGVSQDREKFGNKIYRDLRDTGYTVYALHPKLTEVEGDPCYAKLADLPVLPDVVNVVVPPQAALGVVAECTALGIKNLWLQPGSESEAVIEAAYDAGLTLVHNACIMIQKQSWDD